MARQKETIHCLGITATIFLFVCLLVLSLMGKDDKLTAEKLVAEHLESIGTPEARANLKSRSLQGQGMMVILQGGSGALSGSVTHKSEGNKSSFLFEVDDPSYQGEHIVFDGQDGRVGWAYQGRRSELGEFIQAHSYILREGLLGGTLSTAWPLLDLESKKPRLGYHGLKKVQDRKLHRLEYRPEERGGDLRIDLYFEPETFRHVKTIYHFGLAPGIGRTAGRTSRRPRASTGPGRSALQRQTRYLLEETFENFQQMGGLALPALWVLRFSQTDRSTTILKEWEIDFRSGRHNPSVDPESFRPR